MSNIGKKKKTMTCLSSSFRRGGSRFCYIQSKAHTCVRVLGHGLKSWLDGPSIHIIISFGEIDYFFILSFLKIPKINYSSDPQERYERLSLEKTLECRPVWENTCLFWTGLTLGYVFPITSIQCEITCLNRGSIISTFGDWVRTEALWVSMAIALNWQLRQLMGYQTDRGTHVKHLFQELWGIFDIMSKEEDFSMANIEFNPPTIAFIFNRTLVKITLVGARHWTTTPKSTWFFSFQEPQVSQFFLSGSKQRRELWFPRKLFHNIFKHLNPNKRRSSSILLVLLEGVHGASTLTPFTSSALLNSNKAAYIIKIILCY